jgi:hypothetical protein
MIAYLIAIGYFARFAPFIENKYIKTIVMIAGALIGPFFVQPFFKGVVIGIVYAAVSTIVYDYIFAKINALLKDKVGDGGSLPPTILKAVVLSLSLIVAGCSTPNYSKLPNDATTSQKKEALKADAVLKLKDPQFQKGIHDALVFAGKIALKHAVSSEDRTEIRNQLYSWGNAFDSLATGNTVEPEDLEATAKTFNTSFDSESHSEFIDAANGVWLVIFPLLTQAKEPELIRQWLVVLSTAARDAAK